MTGKGVTEEAVLEAIVKLTASAGYPPTVRELGEELGLTSSSTTWFWIHRLERHGKVTHVEGQPRTLRVVAGG